MNRPGEQDVDRRQHDQRQQGVDDPADDHRGQRHVREDPLGVLLDAVGVLHISVPKDKSTMPTTIKEGMIPVSTSVWGRQLWWETRVLSHACAQKKLITVRVLTQKSRRTQVRRYSVAIMLFPPWGYRRSFSRHSYSHFALGPA